jgi:hypothetical protein
VLAAGRLAGGLLPPGTARQFVDVKIAHVDILCWAGVQRRRLLRLLGLLFLALVLVPGLPLPALALLDCPGRDRRRLRRRRVRRTRTPAH